MKRGLKELLNVQDFVPFTSYNRFPDEKGTESSNPSKSPVVGAVLQPFPR